MRKTKEPFEIISPIKQINLYGYNKYFNDFVDLYKKKKLPNRILLTGPKGLGKATFAYHFINFLLTQNEDKPYLIKDNIINEDNLSFKMINTGIHPNFFLIDNKNSEKEIKINQIRELTTFLNKSTYSKNLKIILIDNVESINLYSGNALLKSLEESEVNTFFIIIHDCSYSILKTIKSRTTEFKFFFSSHEKEDIYKKIIQQYNIEYNIKNLNDCFYFDTPGNIFKYITEFEKNGSLSIDNNLDNALTYIDKYMSEKNIENLSLLKLFIEKFYYFIFLKNKGKISKYFHNYLKIIRQIDNMKKYNLDEKNTFILIKNLLVNEAK